MSSLATSARSLGLPKLAALFDAAPPALFDLQSLPRDPRAVEPPAELPKRLLAQLARRGPDPALIGALWPTLADRPLERALLAVDVLAQALWPADEPLLPELRAAATRLGDARPAPGRLGIDLNEHPATDLLASHVDTATLAARPTVELLTRAYAFDLGALHTLAVRGNDLVTKPATLTSIHAWARLLQMARLPSLASVYHDWLSRTLGWRAAALDLCETLFDAHAPHAIAGDAIRPDDLPPAELHDAGVYVMGRMLMMLDDYERAQQATATQPPGLRSDVVRAQLAVYTGDASAAHWSAIDATCTRLPLWRYAAQVRVLVAAQTQPERALQLFHDYVTGFGNDFDCGHDLLRTATPALKRDVVRILAREAATLPHERAPWQLLALALGDAPAAAAAQAEIAARLQSQSAR